ncbi:uncharacterized protein LOC128133694 [Lactuca sativa]|uniref:uncharacterized protein LOC128133694 n=1 Tax=Lactuca sativa TaxID=4236 RepID=UPI000CD9992D|nr:uncharacterized protein LOC128133694 [Lactuca sativa]
MEIDEQVAIFLHILAHNVKNPVIICRFRRLEETISRHSIQVCNAIVRLHTHLLKKLELVPDNSSDQRWKWFKNCFGALDETYIKCLVQVKDQPRYRTRKNNIATNILGVISEDIQFMYVLTGWEGLATDGRVLPDALLRPHGFKIQMSGYYLVDVGYTNGEGMKSQIRNYGPLTSNEEMKLVEALVNITNVGGFKVDNGFKSEATRWKHKTFPYYEDLCIVFGKDLAQGNRARDLMEMEQEVDLEEETQDSDDDFLDSEEVNRTTAVQHDETSASVRSKKRKNRSN